jgi:hypothetical protein
VADRTIPDDYVRLGKHLCPVCCKTFDSGEILIHKQLQSIPEELALTDYELCKECDARNTDGYIALVEIDPTRSSGGTTKKMHEVYRTGRIGHIRRTVATEIFDFDVSGVMVFVSPDLTDKLISMMPDEDGATGESVVSHDE